MQATTDISLLCRTYVEESPKTQKNLTNMLLTANQLQESTQIQPQIA
jgi:hypothetical protein